MIISITEWLLPEWVALAWAISLNVGFWGLLLRFIWLCRREERR